MTKITSIHLQGVIEERLIMKILQLIIIGLAAFMGSCKTAQKDLEPAKHERRILYNSDAANAFSEFWSDGATLSKMDGTAVRAIVRRGIDELAQAGVDSLVMVVSDRFRTTWGPSKVLESEWRHPRAQDDGYNSLRDEEKLDFRQLMAELCQQRGMEFLGCIRMNDRHSGHPVGPFIQENPQWHLKLTGGPAIDFTPEPVRAKLLAYIEELLATVKLDGLELDYMRWCHMFPPGQGEKNAHLLTDFMQKTRALLDAVAQRESRKRLVLGVRVPQTLKECDYLGFDLTTWIKEGLVDFVVPSDFFYTDLNTRVEEFVELAEGTECKIYPAIHPITHRGDDVGINNLSHYRAAAQNFFAKGAAGIEAYNYQYHWGRRIGRDTPWSGYMWPAALGYLRHLRDPQDISTHDRHYRFYPLWGIEEGVAPTGIDVKNDWIKLDRGKTDPSGTQLFRLAEDLRTPKVRATLQFKAVGLKEDESLEVRLNGSVVPDNQTTRRFDANGQNQWEGRVLHPFYLYMIDLNGNLRKPPLINGDNELTVRLINKNDQMQEKVIIEELEVYIYLRG